MANLRQLLLLAFVAAAACSFTGGARAAPKKAAKAAKKVVAKKVAPKKAAPKKAPVAKKGGFSPSTDIGVTPPLGLFDPLGFLSRGPEVYRRYQEIEIKHGRLAMAATLGVIVTEAGIRFPGYISISQDLTFSDVPGTLDVAVFRQDPAYPAGDVVQDLPIDWVRYDDPEVKAFKLNAERNNGRAAMFGILGMISHAALGQDALF